MNNTIRRALRLLVQIAHWIAFVFLAFICVALSSGISKYLNEDIDVSIFVSAIVALALVVIGLFPPLFVRLPGKARVAACALGLPAFVAALGALGYVDKAYERTPKGAQEAKAYAAAAAARTERERQKDELARQEQKRQATLEMVEKLERDIAAAPGKVQRCINWQGQIPALVRHVKDTLHNPRSFEHVQTKVRILRDSGLPVAVMEYRAENGFGAIRTATVSAFIGLDDCSVLAAKDYEPSELKD